MDIQIKTQNVRLTDHLRAYIEQRVGKLDSVNEKTTDAKIELRAEHPRSGGEQFIAQFTIATRGNLLRTEVRNHDQHVAIDQAIEKMKRQIRRYRDRKIDRTRRNAVNLGQLAVEQIDLEEAELEAVDGAVVRTKRFKIQPMDPPEAIEQMELLDHDFYVYFNPDTSQMNVLYRRKDGDYGVIEPEIA